MLSSLSFNVCPEPGAGYPPVRKAALWLAFPGELGCLSAALQAAVLDEGEARRWRAFHRDQDRDHFLVSRFMLRSVLGQYLDVEPSEVRMDLGQQGKPCLAADRHGQAGLEFSLSHTRGCIALLISCGLPCGVDVERLEEGLPVEQLCSPQFFHASERARILHGGPADLRDSRFLSHWTLKEAYLKARGEGLAGLSDQVRVNIDDIGTPGIIDMREAGSPAQHWSCGQVWLHRHFCLSALIQGEVGTVDMVRFDMPA